MWRTVGPTGLLDWQGIRRALDGTEGAWDESMSQALFEQLMVRLAAQERRNRRARQVAQLVRTALAAAMTGAGAYRLLTR